MRRGVMRAGMVPVLGGFALALGIVALVVSEAEAETVCERCQRAAVKRAKEDPDLCKNAPKYTEGTCINNYVTKQCNGKGKPCPDNQNPAPAVVKCEGYLEEGVTCDNGGTGICTNQTWTIQCEENSTKRCLQTQLEPDGKIRASACYTKCECK